MLSFGYCYTNSGVNQQAQKLSEEPSQRELRMVNQIWETPCIGLTASGSIQDAMSYTKVFDDNLHEAIEELCQFLLEDCSVILPQYADEHKRWLVNRSK